MPGATAAPFLATIRRELAAREQRRAAQVRWLWRAAFGVVGAVVLHFIVTRLVYRSPTVAALQAHVDSVVALVVAQRSTPLQPLSPVGSTVRLTDRVSASRIRYTADVTLQLSQPLYAPANSNGTAAYQQMQQSLQAARERDLRHNLLGKDGPAAPEMPLLLQTVHRAGERVVVRVPFEAKRFGWLWRIDAPQVALSTANRTFEGTSLDRYAGVPHIVYGDAPSLADVRRRTELARAYIVAVANEVQKRADAQAAPAAPPAPTLAGVLPDAGLAAGSPRPTDPDVPAVDPNAPAVEPNAPAVDPNAPAVELDGAGLAPGR